MLSEITVVLSPTIYASTILIAETGEGAPWVHMPLSFQSLQGPALDPLVALKHVLYMQLLNVRAVQLWIPLYHIPLIWNG